MIHLVTGLPGHGKTLWTIWTYKQLAERDNRPVHYYNIKELTLPWVALEDPQKWFDVEPNSIVIIDEAQGTFRPAASGAAVPEYIAKLETHRHGGIDLVLITQMPMLLHKNVRMLVGKHTHVVRFFGGQSATIHEWPECKENPKQRKDSQKTNWFYPKEVFGYYKSAEVHTVKRKLPVWFWLMFIAPLVAIGLGWYGFHRLHQLSGIQSMTPDTHTAPGQQGGNTAQQLNQQFDKSQSSSDTKKPKTRAEYLQERQPRLHDVAFTAPVYDEVTKPVTAPYPAACVAMGKKCRCYSQQGTSLDTSEDFCRQVVAKGFFVDWNTNARGGQSEQVQGQQTPQAQPTAASRLNDQANAPALASNDAVQWVPYENPGNKTHSNVKQ